MPKSDAIDTIAGILKGSTLDTIRDNRSLARINAQISYEALFHPDEAIALTLVERLAVATFVAGLHGHSAARLHYAELLESAAGPELLASIEAEVFAGATKGPYGAYPTGPLSTENVDGIDFAVTLRGRDDLGERLSAALIHAHLLTFHPRDAAPESLQLLIDAGFDTDAIVTLSQLIGFLAFQFRVAQGLQTLNNAIAARTKVQARP